MRIVLLGAPGAGKGTHCKRIVQRYGLLHLSSGDILRQQRRDATALGKKAQSYMDAGQLVPDPIVVQMMIDAIKHAPSAAEGKAPAAGFILDGFPRTVNQAVELDNSLAHNGQAVDAILNLQVDEHIVFERMTGRRSCPKCGAVYHLKNLPPKVDGICDHDGTKLIQRRDDSPEVVAKRLETYYQQTEPVVVYYKNNSRTVHDIDANDSADKVANLIFKKLDATNKV
jgi:adenylate kinase